LSLSQIVDIVPSIVPLMLRRKTGIFVVATGGSRWQVRKLARKYTEW
jgi:hypothetical protein